MKHETNSNLVVL